MTPTRGNRSLLDRKIHSMGWLRVYRVLLTHYGYSTSRSHATSTRITDYVAVPEEAAGLLDRAECHQLQYQEKGVAPMLYIGSPAWGYKEWVGNFFPARTPASDFLRLYSRRLNCVEGNTSLRSGHNILDSGLYKA